jgi:outer membrane protein assembly complex protein YaeT
MGAYAAVVRQGCWGIGLGLALMMLVVYPAAGQNNPIVERIVVEGNTFIDSTRIQELMITRPAGFFRKHRLNRAVLRADIDAIESFYRNSGFLYVRVRESREASGQNRVTIRIAIDEGPRFMVKAVHILGVRHLAEADIRRSMLTRAGQPYYPLFVAADKRYIQTLADRNALLDARIRLDQVQSDADTAVTVTFLIDEGKPIRVGNIVVRGLQKTRPFVVLREMEIRSGDLFDNAKLARSQTRLFQTGLFRSIRMEPAQADSALATRDLLVSVTELPGGEFSFGGGIASVEKFRGSISVVHRNWLGRAILIGINGQASELIQQVEAGITQPWLFKTRTTGTLRGFFLRQDRRSHVKREIGTSIGFTRELSRAFRVHTTYTIKNVHISSLSDTLIQSDSIADTLRSRREGSLTQLLLYDTRDDLLNPTVGFFGQIQGSMASPLLGSSSENRNSTFTINAVFQKYIPVKRFPDLAASLSLGYVRALSNGLIPIDKRLLLGGDRSVRGFGLYQIGFPEGGVLAISMQNEIRIPVPWVILVGFLDLGGVGKTVRSFGLDDMHVGFGGGLRVSSPLGLIRGDVGFHRKSDIDAPTAGLYDRTFFYFGLGQAF